MSCDKPNGDCTTPTNCADCGCAGSTVDPVLPKCQNVSLTAGTFTNATVVVNSAGCIASVISGAPELYTPDECCGGSGGGGGSVGPRGPKGDPGAAATVGVDPAVGTSTGTSWIVENIGTTSAAVFKFTAPAPTTGGSSTSGATGNINGLKVEAGSVKQLPVGLVTAIQYASAGTNAGLLNVSAVENLNVPGRFDLSINADILISTLRSEFNGQNTAQANLISDLTAAVSDLVNSVTMLQSTLTSQQSTLTSLQNSLNSMSAELIDLRGDFEAYKASHP